MIGQHLPLHAAVYHGLLKIIYLRWLTMFVAKEHQPLMELVAPNMSVCVESIA